MPQGPSVELGIAGFSKQPHMQAIASAEQRMVAILTQSKELLAEINRELPDGLLPDEWQQLRQEVRQALVRGVCGNAVRAF